MNRVFLCCFLGACAFAGGAVSVISLRTPNWVGAQGKETWTPGPALPGAGEVETLFERVSGKASSAVVSVESSRPTRGAASSGSRGKVVEESGSGFIVTFPGREGFFILTNNHVVNEAQPHQITVRMDDGRLLRVDRVYTDAETDVAVLKLGRQAIRLPVLRLGDSDNVRVGQWVLAVGSPFGLSQTVTHGIISARERGQVNLGNSIRIKDFLQTDAAINPGSSGGPLLNLRAEVIGINTAIASHTGNSSGVAFSIPINLVNRVAKDLLDNGSVSRGYLGMQVAGTFDAKEAVRLGLDRVQGAMVERVYANTPASTAGLKTSDIVLRVDGVVIRNGNHLINLISKTRPGRQVQLYVWRNGEVETINATIGNWNSAQSRFQIP